MKIGPVHKLALFYIESIKVGDEFPHSFWKNSYNTHSKDIIDNLVSKKYVTESFNLENTLPKLTTEEIRELLKKYQLDASGTKKELIKRVQNNIDKLEDDSLPGYYLLTEKGRYLRDHSHHILYFHENDFDTDIFKADKIYKRHKKMNSKEIIEKILKDGFNASIKSESYNNAYYYSIKLARFYELYNMESEEVRAIIIMMACNIRQAFKSLEVPNFQYRESYGSEIIGNEQELQSHFKSFASKYNWDTSKKKNYITETLFSVFKNHKLNNDVANIIIWSLEQEDDKIDSFIKEKFDIETRKNRKYELNKKIELYKELNKTKPEHTPSKSSQNQKKGSGCMMFILLPGSLATYGIIELLFI